MPRRRPSPTPRARRPSSPHALRPTSALTCCSPRRSNTSPARPSFLLRRSLFAQLVALESTPNAVGLRVSPATCCCVYRADPFTAASISVFHWPHPGPPLHATPQDALHSARRAPYPAARHPNDGRTPRRPCPRSDRLVSPAMVHLLPPSSPGPRPLLRPHRASPPTPRRPSTKASLMPIFSASGLRSLSVLVSESRGSGSTSLTSSAPIQPPSLNS